ncbi:hypothetical protein CYMTET_47762 [Cymbomonas tetramitiformis]|uniref:Uncharacterized protein n=1 Tax=Cymbomonas tetramitiformis TaxID=36881 RepID=A0AAE0EVP7_9CHLO|nr:hypothetical protein CYMTET_47762 [Cymbomonas tetramitiformis]|eukprot:gene363-687_t
MEEYISEVDESLLLPLPSDASVAERQHLLDVGKIAPLFMSRISVYVILTLTEEVPFDLMHILPNGKPLYEILRYSEEDRDDFAWGLGLLQDNLAFQAIESLVKEKDTHLDVLYTTDSEPGRDAVFINTAQYMLETLLDTTKLATNKARRYYLYSVLSCFHCHGVTFVRSFREALERAVELEASSLPHSEAEPITWVLALEHERAFVESSTDKYYMHFRVFMVWYDMGVLAGRPTGLVGMPEAKTYDHVEYFRRVDQGVFKLLWQRFRYQTTDSDGLIRAMWRP